MALFRCDECGGTFNAGKSNARFCSGACRTRSSRRAKAEALAGSPAAAVVPLERRRVADPLPVSGSALEAATRAELQAIGQEGSVLGISALALARRIDADRDTGSAMQAMVARLALVMGSARAAGSAPTGTLVDELRRRREEIRGA